MAEPTFEDLIDEAANLPETERMRELCALMCDAQARAFWGRGARHKSDGAKACARAIRVSGSIEQLEATIRLIVRMTGR